MTADCEIMEQLTQGSWAMHSKPCI